MVLQADGQRKEDWSNALICNANAELFIAWGEEGKMNIEDNTNQSGFMLFAGYAELSSAIERREASTVKLYDGQPREMYDTRLKLEWTKACLEREVQLSFNYFF